MEQLVWYKKVLGYLYPITISKQENEQHPDLRLKYYQGQYQLESGGALYSDGFRYTPFRLAYQFLDNKNKLQKIDNFLLLGAGLGSALDRLHKVFHLYPEAHLVEQDPDIIALSKKYLNSEKANNLNFRNQDALEYLTKCSLKFDLIGVDLFNNLENSSLLCNTNFWQMLKKVSELSTILIINTIFIKKLERQSFEELLRTNFTFERLNHKPNYIYILNLRSNG